MTSTHETCVHNNSAHENILQKIDEVMYKNRNSSPDTKWNKHQIDCKSPANSYANYLILLN